MATEQDPSVTDTTTETTTDSTTETTTEAPVTETTTTESTTETTTSAPQAPQEPTPDTNVGTDSPDSHSPVLGEDGSSDDDILQNAKEEGLANHDAEHANDDLNGRTQLAQ